MSLICHIRIARNRLIHLPGRGPFKALRRLDGQRVQFEHLEDGELLTLSDHEISLMFLKGKLSFDPAVGCSREDNGREATAAMSVKEVDEACRRYELAKRFLAEDHPRSLRRAEAFLCCLGMQEGPTRVCSGRTLLRWVERLANASLVGASALAPRHHLKGTRGSRLDPRLETFILEAIDEVYMTGQRYPVAEVCSAVSAKLLKLEQAGISLSMPGTSTVTRRVLAGDELSTKIVRHGRKAAEAAFRPAGTYPSPARTNEVWQIDHTRADVFVWDDVSLKRVLARPWITTIIDVFTRCIVGVHVSFDPPSYVSVMACLWRGILPKEAILDANGLNGCDWSCMGLPESIVMDNGKEFHSDSLKRALALLGVNCFYAESGNPRRKPHIERVQGTMNRAVCHRMAGTTFSSIAQRGEVDAQRNARHDLAFLRARLIEWVVNVYHLSPHSGTGEAPQRRWHRFVHRHPISLPPDALDLRILLSPIVPGGRTLRRDGILIDRLTYWSPELTGLLAEIGVETISVEVRVDPDDTGTIWIQHPRYRKFMRATAREAGYAGIPRAVHLHLLKLKRDGEKHTLANPKLIENKAVLRDNLATGHKRKKVKPGGAKEARLLSRNLEGSLRAVADGHLPGSVPVWAAPAALLDEAALTDDGWPVASDIVFVQAQSAQPEERPPFVDRSAARMKGNATIAAGDLSDCEKSTTSQLRFQPRVAKVGSLAEAKLIDVSDDWGTMEIPRLRGWIDTIEPVQEGLATESVDR